MKTKKSDLKVKDEVVEKVEKVEETAVEETTENKVEEKSYTRGNYRRRDYKEDPAEVLARWVPKTKLGELVKNGKVKSIDEVLDKGMTILEPEVVDSLLKIESDLLFAGQSKGKFGGGKRRAWRQAQKKTKEGNILTFSAIAIVGDKQGHIGLGIGKAKETLPAREKAIRKAKLNLMKIKRGSGSFEGSSKELHSIPYKVEGKCGSCRITLIPAPLGTGLVIGDEGKKILKLAGISDIYSKSFGQTGTTINYGRAVMDALRKLK